MTTLNHRDNSPLTLPKWFVIAVLAIVSAVAGGYGKDYVLPTESLSPQQAAEVRAVVEKESPYLRDRDSIREALKDQTKTLQELLDRTARIEGMLGRERSRTR